MGNSSSKAASRAASAAKRSYPSTTLSTTTAPSPSQARAQAQAQIPSQPRTSPSAPPAAQVHPSPQTHPPTSTRSEIVELDARDPHFASSLSLAGRAQRIPQPPPSPSSPAAQPQSAFPTSSRPPPLQQAPAGQHVFPNTNTAASSSSNPALQIVATRQRIARQFAAEQEGLGRRGFEGRTLLSAREVREALGMRAGGVGDEEVERRMRLRRGVMRGLGGGMVGNLA